jgi:hypothetical protein
MTSRISITPSQTTGASYPGGGLCESGTASRPVAFAGVLLEVCSAIVVEPPGQGDAYTVRASAVKALRDCGSV